MLLALVDAEYLFRAIDVGASGWNSDGGILAAYAFGKHLAEDRQLSQKMHLFQVLPCLVDL